MLKKLFLTITLLQASPIPIPKHLAPSDGHAVYDQSRSSEYPCIAHVTFRKFCDHQLCCTLDTIDPDKIMLGDTLYVADWYMDWFFQNVHPQIQHQYILVSGDTDELHPSHWFHEANILYDPKVGAWFCSNLVLSNHPKLTTLPIGVTALAWDFPKETFLDIASSVNKLESPLLYSCFTPVNNVSRRYLRELFANKSFCYSEKTSVGKVPFWRTLAQFKFSLTPSGQVIDSPRIWESLTFHTIPICAHSPLDALYAGTPTVLVHSWEEITEEFLKSKFSEIQDKLLTGKISYEKVHFDYWAKQINQVKTSIREKCWEGANLEAALFDPQELSDIQKVLYTRSDDPYDDPGRCLFLVYGKFLGLRAFQLGHAMSGFQKILVADEYALENGEHHKLMASFAKKESQYLLLNNPAQFTNSDSDFGSHIKWLSGSRVKMFIDLTHYRHRFIDKLWAFCQMVPHGSIVCGNRGDDPYVQKQLRAFSERYFVSIDTHSNLWYYRKVHHTDKLTF